MSAARQNSATVGVGVAACAVCCAGPILGALAALGLGTAAGFALFGIIAVVIGAVAAGIVLARRRRASRARRPTLQPPYGSKSGGSASDLDPHNGTTHISASSRQPAATTRRGVSNGVSIGVKVDLHGRGHGYVLPHRPGGVDDVPLGPAGVVADDRHARALCDPDRPARLPPFQGHQC